MYKTPVTGSRGMAWGEASQSLHFFLSSFLSKRPKHEIRRTSAHSDYTLRLPEVSIRVVFLTGALARAEGLDKSSLSRRTKPSSLPCQSTELLALDQDPQPSFGFLRIIHSHTPHHTLPPQEGGHLLHTDSCIFHLLKTPLLLCEIRLGICLPL